MTKNGHTRSTDQPKHGRPRGSIQAERDGDNEKTGVELRSSGTECANNKILAIQTTDEEQTSDDDKDIEQQGKVGQECVDGQHSENACVVGGEEAQVVVHARLSFTKVGRLRNTLEVAELPDGTQVLKAGSHGAIAQALEAFAKVEAGRDNVKGNLNSRHDEYVVCRKLIGFKLYR